MGRSSRRGEVGRRRRLDRLTADQAVVPLAFYRECGGQDNHLRVVTRATTRPAVSSRSRGPRVLRLQRAAKSLFREGRGCGYLRQCGGGWAITFTLTSILKSNRFTSAR